jgi:hypothetical protein
MPNITKETPEIIQKIKELANKGFNNKRISKEIGLARGTIKRIAQKNNIILAIRIRPDTPFKAERFVELLKSGKTLTQARKEAGVPTQTAHDIVEKLNLRHLVRTRAESALDKILSLEEAQTRLPINSGLVIGFENSRYQIQTEDGFIYYKKSAKLYQGDPRNKSGTKRILEDVKSELLQLGYEYLEGWTINRKPFKAKHIICGFIRENRLKNFHEQECPRCTNTGISAQENEVKNWIESIGLQTIRYKFSKRVTKPKEIDIYISSKKVGIEYNGLYWHTEDRIGKNTHFEKMKMANEDGIRLITIFEHEWQNRNKQVKNFLKSVLGISSRTVGGRKTEVKQIDDSLGKMFMNENHIQGAAHGPLAYFGLYLEEELVATMSLGKHHRGSDDTVVVLDRLCFLDGINIQGGSSKLLHYSIEWAKQNGYQKMISWSDNRWSEGKVYEKMGFLLEDTLKPDYFYIKGGEVFSKQSLKKKGEEKTSGRTEKELRAEQGYERIYDCGKKRWILNLL